jgi:hypothetical protein
LFFNYYELAHHFIEEEFDLGGFSDFFFRTVERIRSTRLSKFLLFDWSSLDRDQLASINCESRSVARW